MPCGHLPETIQLPPLRLALQETMRLPGEARNTWTIILDRVGYAASGVVFVIVGALLLAAALHSNAAEVRALAGP